MTDPFAEYIAFMIYEYFRVTGAHEAVFDCSDPFSISLCIWDTQEQRQMIIPEYCEKIGHHELQASRAEQDRQILQEELWRQQKDFREVHQQNLTEMEELRKFQSSTFDMHAKLIEDQNTIMEFSG